MNTQQNQTSLFPETVVNKPADPASPTEVASTLSEMVGGNAASELCSTASLGSDAPLYLVDGSGYIFRAFYAVAPLSNQNGLPTNALFGFTRMLGKLLRTVKAEYIAVTFDTKEPTFRHNLYTEYKANRAECPAELIPQMPYFRSITKALGIGCLEKAGYEADDIIATLAVRFAAVGRKVVIVSGDKDLLQLVGENISVVDAMRDITYSPKEVVAKFGVGPEQVRDYLSLIGDSSDNVPGVKGIGPKTAEKLLQHFGSIEEMLKRSNEIEGIDGLRGAKGIREKIESGGEAIRLSQRLIDLDTNVEPFNGIGPNGISSVEEFYWEPPAHSQLQPLFEELDFLSLIPNFSGGAARSGSVAKSAAAAGKDFRAVTAAELPGLAEQLRSAGAFAFDTETSSLDVLTCELMGISVSSKRGEARYIPVSGANVGAALVPLEEVVKHLGPVLADPAIKKYGVNLKFDVGVLEEQGIPVRGLVFDAMLCSHLLQPDGRQNGLKALAQRFLNEKMVSYEELTDNGKKALSEVAFADLVSYAAHDAEASLSLFEEMNPLLDCGSESTSSVSLRTAFSEVEMPLVEVLSAIERKGIKVDIPFLAELGQRFTGELLNLEREIWKLAGKEFNINSPKQLGAVLFDDLKIPTKGVKKTQHGFSTDAGVLSVIAEHHPIAVQLLEYREVHKLNSTYVEALQRLVHPKTGRIHTSFNQAITATGRLSSTEPNLQNIPVKNARGRLIRRAFIAEPGNLLLSVDYSQIELRILAHLSGDTNLKSAFRNNEDIHRRTAEEMFGILPTNPEELKELRRVAKTINFGIIYGMGAFRLAGELEISRKQAQEYIDSYFARYPSVQQYFDGLKKDIEVIGYVQTLFGRRRLKSEVDTSGRDSGYAERSLLNAPIQGSAAEVLKVAMIKLAPALEKFGEGAVMVLQVHDELVFEVQESLFEEVREVVVRVMEGAVKLEVPLVVDTHYGKSWGEDI